MQSLISRDWTIFAGLAAAAALVFTLDANTPQSWAVEMLYLPLLSFAAWRMGARAVWLFYGLCIVLTLIASELERRQYTENGIWPHLANDAILVVVGGVVTWLALARRRFAATMADTHETLRRREQELRESVERFELAVEGSNDGLWDARPEGEPWPWRNPNTEVWYSPQFKHLLGFRDDEFPHVLQSWSSRLHPDDRDRVFTAVERYINEKIPYDVEYRLKTKAGDYRWFRARGAGSWDAQGRFIRMSGSLRDVTEIKEYQARVEQSEALWRSLVENAPDVILLSDPEGKIKFINRKTEDAAATVGQTVYHYIRGHDWPLIREALAKVRQIGQPQQVELQAGVPGGPVAWFSIRIGPIYAGGQLESIVIIATDVTERKIGESRLHRERQWLRRLLDLQERERQLVAYDIHDGLVQYLTGALMHLEAGAAAHEVAGAAASDFETGMNLLREALAEGRRLISGLRPPILDEMGVVPALQFLVDEAQKVVPDVELIDSTHCGRLAAAVESAIFRTTQEILANVQKHSGAKRARVELIEHGGWVRLIVRDWGKGFNPSAADSSGFGLQGIRQRARLLGAGAIIESVEGAGTIVVIDFPRILAEPTEDIDTAPSGGEA